MQRVDISNFKNKKTALVLSGGVVKAASWHIGVALALEDIGFTFKHNNSKENPNNEISTYVGSSAGALMNLYFASGFGPGEIIRSMLRDSSSRLKPITYKEMLCLKRVRSSPPPSEFFDPFSDLPFLTRKILKPFLKIPGIFSTQGLYDYIKENVLVSNSFDDYKADLFVVATQLDHSRKVISGKYKYPNPGHDPTAVYYVDLPVAESVAASMSVPPFYAPYPIWNSKTKQVDYYVDGEIRETLSTHVAIDNKCEFIISSWTHTPYHYHDEIGSLVNYGIPTICLQAIHLAIQKKIIGSRARRKTAQDIVNTVSDYMSHNNFTSNHRRNILSILERKLDYNPNVHLIDIFPKHENYKVFFKNSFSLDPDKNSEIVSAGYKRAMEVFQDHEWES